MNDGKSKFGYVAMAFWTGSAFILDLVSLIPFVGDFAGPIFWISFTFYLWKSGYGFLNPKRLAVGGLDMVIKMIPVIQEIPVELALGAAAVIAMLKIEEKTGLKLPGMGKGGISIKATPGHAAPANIGGRRMPGTSTGTSGGENASNTGTNKHVTSAPLNFAGVRVASNQKSNPSVAANQFITRPKVDEEALRRYTNQANEIYRNPISAERPKDIEDYKTDIKNEMAGQK